MTHHCLIVLLKNDLYPKQEPINAPEELDSSTGESHCAIEQNHSDNSTLYANSDFSKLPFVSLGRSGPGILGAQIKAPISSMCYGRRVIQNEICNTDLQSEVAAESSKSSKSRSEKQLQQIFHKYNAILCPVTGCCNIIEHEILIIEGSKPVVVPPYKLTTEKRTDMVNQVRDMLKQGIIEPSNSSWCSSPVMVPKGNKHGQKQWRMAIDYRALNKVTVPDRYPLPTTEQLLDSLHGAKVFSSLDLKGAF